MSLFLDGLEEDGTPFGTQHLNARLSDISEDGAMWVGLSSNGKDGWLFFLNICIFVFIFFLHCFRDALDPYSLDPIIPQWYCIKNILKS